MTAHYKVERTGPALMPWIVVDNRTGLRRGFPSWRLAMHGVERRVLRRRMQGEVI